MKAFISFILLFSISLLLINSSNLYSLDNFNSSDLILIEKTYQIEMNVKEAVLESARVKEKANECVLLEVSKSTLEKRPINVEEIKDCIKEEVNGRIEMVNELDFSDFDFEIWCGKADSSIKKLKKEMIDSKSTLICENCTLVKNNYCLDFIDVNLILEVEENNVPEVSSITLGKNSDVFGISIYSKKFQISSVSYLPESEVKLN